MHSSTHVISTVHALVVHVHPICVMVATIVIMIIAFVLVIVVRMDYIDTGHAFVVVNIVVKQLVTGHASGAPIVMMLIAIVIVVVVIIDSRYGPCLCSREQHHKAVSHGPCMCCFQLLCDR